MEGRSYDRTKDKGNKEKIRMKVKRGKEEKCGNLESESGQGRRKGICRKDYEGNRNEC